MTGVAENPEESLENKHLEESLREQVADLQAQVQGLQQQVDFAIYRYHCSN